MQTNTEFVINRRSILLLLMTAFVIYTGCAGFKKGPVIQADESNVEVIQYILHKNYLNLETLQAHGQISVFTPQQKFSGTIKTNILKPDSLFVKLEAVLGLDVGVLFADRKNFLFYSPMEKMCFTGSSRDSLKLDRFIGFNLTFQQLMQAVSGIVQLDELQDMTVHHQNDELFISGWIGDYTYRYWIDREWGTISKVEVVDIWDQVIRREEYSKFVKIGKVRLPKMIRYSQPLRKESLTVFYDYMDINRKLYPKDFYIKLPKDVFKFEL